MKAVNLLPPELRGASKAAAAAPAAAGDATGAFMVLGALAACVLALAGYVLTTNTVKQRHAQLADATQRAEATAKATAKLKPYADFETLVNTRVQTVRDLATTRFDWEQALRDLSRAVPADVTLTALKGTVSSTVGGGAGGSNALRGALDVPAVELSGCTRSQTAVAQLMARLRTVDGVTRVSLSKSDKETEVTATIKNGSGGNYPACKGNPPAFEVVAFFEGDAAAAVDPAAAPAAPTGAAGSTATGTDAATKTAQSGAQASKGTNSAGSDSSTTTTPVSTGGAK